VLACTGNPDFDIALPIEKDECLLIEARFSNPKAKTYLSITHDAVTKHQTVLEHDKSVPGTIPVMDFAFCPSLPISPFCFHCFVVAVVA
jgi:hypothetical protein